MENQAEIWKPVVGYEGLYEVSNIGNVERISKTKPRRRLKQTINKYGYVMVSLSKNNKPKTTRLHRVVLMAFKGIDLDRIFCNHIDGVKTNNNILNLEWVTSSENMQHAYKTGLLFKDPFKSHNRRFSEDKIINIRKLLFDKVQIKEISKLYGVSRQTISSIKRGASYTGLGLYNEKQK